jgi:large conductance mechanosensitive channel
MTEESTIVNTGNNTEMLEELRKIRSLLEPKPASPLQKGFVKEFKQFIEQYKVMGLAVAFILGIYLGVLVQALVNDLVMPIIDLFTPGAKWQSLNLGPFQVGAFLGALVTFLIIALVIFLLVKLTSKFGIK